MKIHVTEEDIKDGLRGWCPSCPIALAMRRAGFAYPMVDKLSVGFDKGKERAQAPLPTRAIRFINRFDAGKPVKPFTFLLAAVPDYTTVTP